MAHVYIGDKSKVDSEVLEAVKLLPDDFHVFAEFVVGQRNIDWFICRVASAEAHSTVVVTELKRVSRPLRGQMNSIWQSQDSQGFWQNIVPSNNSDTNYYYQAVNSANAVKTWMYNNQRLFLETPEPRLEHVFKAWPDLLLLSENNITHQLPYAPDNRYGAWFMSLPPWITHLENWRPNMGLPLSATELQNLGQALGLTHMWPIAQPAIPPEDPVSAAPEIAPLVAYFTTLQQRIAVLEERIARLEAR